jgi:FkbM family methyltransferase
MATSNPRLAAAFLRYASPLARLRTLPVFANLLHKAGRNWPSTDTVTWAQIERGLASKLWVFVDPQTDRRTLRGEHELPLQQALSRHLRPGMTFYDLGANFGFFSLIAARIVGPEGHVIAFEPDPVVFLRLRQNLLQNGFRHAVAEAKALWFESATVPFSSANLAESPGRSSGHISTSPNGSNILCVEAVSLDDYASCHAAPDFINCDVQGAECEVFHGAANTLRQWHPTIVCEIRDSYSHRALTGYLLDFGYTCYALDRNHLLAVLE